MRYQWHDKIQYTILACVCPAKREPEHFSLRSGSPTPLTLTPGERFNSCYTQNHARRLDSRGLYSGKYKTFKLGWLKFYFDTRYPVYLIITAWPFHESLHSGSSSSPDRRAWCICASAYRITWSQEEENGPGSTHRRGNCSHKYVTLRIFCVHA